jgi:hypothetical protein
MSDDITIPRGRLPVDMINRILTYKGTVYENRVTMRFKFDLPKHGDATKNSAFASVILGWDTDIDRSWIRYIGVDIGRYLHRPSLLSTAPRPQTELPESELVYEINNSRDDRTVNIENIQSWFDYDTMYQFTIHCNYDVDADKDKIRSEFKEDVSNIMVKIMNFFPPPSIPRQPMPLPSNPTNNYRLKDTTVYDPDKWNPDRHPDNVVEVMFGAGTGYGPGYEFTVTFFLVNNKMMVVSREGVIFPQFRPKLKI